jgi:uncharacterized membrane protein
MSGTEVLVKNEVRFVPMAVLQRLDESGRYRSPAPGLLWGARALALVALGIASYLLWISATGEKAVGCSDLPGMDCEHVLASRWSRWFDVPVSLLATLVYAGSLLTMLAIGPHSSERTERDAWKLLVILAVSTGAAACWFIALQVLVLRSFCIYCIADHVCGILLAAFLFWQSPARWRSSRSGRMRDPMIIKPHMSWTLALLGLAGPAVLVGGQVLFPGPGLQLTEYADSSPKSAQNDKIRNYPPDSIFSKNDTRPSSSGTSEESKSTFKEKPGPKLEPPVPNPKGLDSQNPANSSPAKASDSGPTKAQPTIPNAKPVPQTYDPKLPAKGLVSPETPNKPIERPVAQRLLPVLNGKENVDVYQHPRLGNPQAAYVIVEIYDYSCPHCRLLYPVLEEARKHFGDQFAIVLLPCPLNKDCNKYVKNPHYGAEDACHYARFALALWRVNPEAFEKFHAWMFAEPTKFPPSAQAAKERAEELIGAEALRNALADDAIGRQIEENGRMWALDGNKTLPKLLSKQYTITGEAHSAQELFQSLEKALGVRPK